MVIGDMVQSHKDKLNKKTNDHNWRRLHKPGTPEGHRSMISHFNVINKCGQKVFNKGGVDYEKHIDSVNNTYMKNEETGTLRNEINCGGIGTLKWHIIHVISRWAPILTVYDVII